MHGKTVKQSVLALSCLLVLAAGARAADLRDWEITNVTATDRFEFRQGFGAKKFDVHYRRNMKKGTMTGVSVQLYFQREIGDPMRFVGVRHNVTLSRQGIIPVETERVQGPGKVIAKFRKGSLERRGVAAFRPVGYTATNVVPSRHRRPFLHWEANGMFLSTAGRPFARPGEPINLLQVTINTRAFTQGSQVNPLSGVTIEIYLQPPRGRKQLFAFVNDVTLRGDVERQFIKIPARGVLYPTHPQNLTIELKHKRQVVVYPTFVSPTVFELVRINSVDHREKFNPPLEKKNPWSVVRKGRPR